jgi:hypothetical protein
MAHRSFISPEVGYNIKFKHVSLNNKFIYVFYMIKIIKNIKLIQRSRK